MKNITLPTGTEHLYLEEIAHFIADSMNPEGSNDPDGVLYELDKIQAWNEAEQAAKEGALRVRHPGTRGPFPHNLKMRDNAVVLLSDVVAYLADRGLSVTTQEPSNESPAKPHRIGWREICTTHIVNVLQTGQYATAKELFSALEKKAGPDSPFDKGTGSNRGSLFVREIAKPLALKTLQNEFASLRKIAKL